MAATTRNYETVNMESLRGETYIIIDPDDADMRIAEDWRRGDEGKEIVSAGNLVRKRREEKTKTSRGRQHRSRPGAKKFCFQGGGNRKAQRQKVRLVAAAASWPSCREELRLP